MSAPGVAVREFPLKSGHGTADYLLYVDGKVVGVVEAKPAGFTLTGVEVQSEKYSTGLPEWTPRADTTSTLRLREHGRGDPVHQQT